MVKFLQKLIGFECNRLMKSYVSPDLESADYELLSFFSLAWTVGGSLIETFCARMCREHVITRIANCDSERWMQPTAIIDSSNDLISSSPRPIPRWKIRFQSSLSVVPYLDCVVVAFKIREDFYCARNKESFIGSQLKSRSSALNLQALTLIPCRRCRTSRVRSGRYFVVGVCSIQYRTEKLQLIDSFWSIC